MTFELHYNGRVDDATGKHFLSDYHGEVVVTHAMYDENTDKTTFYLEKV